MPYHTKQQQAILTCLQAREEESLSAADLAEDLRAAGSAVGLATIYRQLEKLAQLGAIHKITTEDGALYQFCPHPDHVHGCFLLRCAVCGRITHLDCSHLQSLAEHLQAEHQFCIDPRQTVLTGICHLCREKEVSHE